MYNEVECILKEYYEPTDDPGWYRCYECQSKIYAGKSEYSDLLIHEMRDHPKRD